VISFTLTILSPWNIKLKSILAKTDHPKNLYMKQIQISLKTTLIQNI